MTPMQQQYNRIKTQYPDDIVLFRLGDFYEAFNRDAETASQVLGITLTGRGKDANRVPMAGIPYHALGNYLPKLVDQGLKVVVVEQMTEPKPGEIVDRDVTKIYTAGTLTDENTLTDNKNNYLVSLHSQKDGKVEKLGMAIVDISTGKLQVAEFASKTDLKAELERIQPAEILVTQDDLDLIPAELLAKHSLQAESNFETKQSVQACLEQFQVKTLKGFGIEADSVMTPALGALISYLQTTQRTAISHIRQVSIYPRGVYMLVDQATIRNLELVYSPATGDSRTSVYAMLNECHTNMGKRKLYDWLLRPLVDLEQIQFRQNATKVFFSDSILADKVRSQLQRIADIERIVSRLGVGGGNARELNSLRDSLVSGQEIGETLASPDTKGSELLKQISESLRDNEAAREIIDLINTAIHPEPPISTSEGGMIAAGYNAEVDELREIRQGGKGVLAQIQAREIERTGITTLKVGFNKVFGYYIEVTASHTSKVPGDYIRKQTLTNAERYITQELKEWEDKVLTAEDRLIKLELSIFNDIRSKIVSKATELLKLADQIATVDVLANFGLVARNHNYCQPKFAESSNLKISKGRHLVVERLQSEFTPNDISFDGRTNFALITGPNMSGKSTYIRQIALLVLLAQIGMFVPAAEMELKVFDRIFTRVGAADNLSRGESTFMVEMFETANILNNATSDSLVILDEVGRGTSTYDGVAIAWSIVEHICQKVKCDTLFATHYHELTTLAEKFPNLANFQVEVTEQNGEIVFQHHIIPGSASRSYGVHVAKLAGVPDEVVNRAEEILAGFEDKSKKPKTKDTAKTSKPQPHQRPRKVAPEQLDLL